MKNDSIALWKLKQGKAFLSAYLECATRIRSGKRHFTSKRIERYISLGLLHEIPRVLIASAKSHDRTYRFTLSGMSIYNQLSLLVNRGIIYQNDEGKYIWRNFQFIEAH